MEHLVDASSMVCSHDQSDILLVPPYTCHDMVEGESMIDDELLFPPPDMMLLIYEHDLDLMVWLRLCIGDQGV